jgi:hypothetical protein
MVAAAAVVVGCTTIQFLGSYNAELHGACQSLRLVFGTRVT